MKTYISLVAPWETHQMRLLHFWVLCRWIRTNVAQLPMFENTIKVNYLFNVDGAISISW